MFEVYAVSSGPESYNIAYIIFNGMTYIANGAQTDLSWVSNARTMDFNFYIDGEFVSHEIFVDLRYNKQLGLQLVSQKV